MLNDFLPNVTYYVYKKCDDIWKLPHSLMLVCDLTFVLEGHATYYVNGKQFALNEGDAVFIHSGETRRAGDADMRCAAFNFKYTASQPLELPPVIQWKKSGALHTLLQEYRTEWTLREFCWESKCRALFIEIICEALRCTHPGLRSPLIRQMERYILDHLLEPITVREIAESVGRHPNYCGMVFRREKGCGLQEYIHRLRLEHAVNLMREGDLTIGEIALQSGYHDIYYFSRVFKNIKGVSPSAYAANLMR